MHVPAYCTQNKHNTSKLSYYLQRTNLGKLFFLFFLKVFSTSTSISNPVVDEE